MPLPSISEIFNWVKPVSTPAPTAKPAAVDPTKPGDPTVKVPDGTGPVAFPKVGEGEKSPLANYEKLWENDPNAPKPASMVPTLTADPAKLIDAAKNIDFAKVLKPEDLEAAMKDPAALAKVINQAAQAGYAQSAHATTKILEAALTQQAKVFSEQIMPDILRRHASSQAVLSLDNPVFQNPAVAPIVDMVKNQVISKFPTASAADIAKHTAELLSSMSTEIAKASGLTVAEAVKDTRPGGPKKEINWADYFGVPDNPVS